MGYIKECLKYVPPRNGRKVINTDRISSMNMVMVFAEEVHRITLGLRNDNKNKLNNINIFKRHYDMAFKKQKLRNRLNIYR
jgi:hypothetical protein